MYEDPIAHILLVDRDPATGDAIVAALSSNRLPIERVDHQEKALNCIESTTFDVMITELSTHRIDGMRLMEVARERNPDICVILIAGDPEIELATEAMRQGAYDYQTRPLNLGKLEAVIQREEARVRGGGADAGDGAWVPIVILTHSVREAVMNEALLAVQALPDVVGEIMRIRVEHFDEGSE